MNYFNDVYLDKLNKKQHACMSTSVFTRLSMNLFLIFFSSDLREKTSKLFVKQKLHSRSRRCRCSNPIAANGRARRPTK